jgi:hypothetical protein
MIWRNTARPGETMCKTVIQRGEKLADIVKQDGDKDAQTRRINAILELHSLKWTDCQRLADNTVIVDARAFYRAKEVLG